MDHKCLLKRHLISYGAAFFIVISWAIISLVTYYVPLGRAVFPEEGIFAIIMGLFIPAFVKKALLTWIIGLLISLALFYGLYWPKIIYQHKARKTEKLVVFLLSFLPEIGRWSLLVSSTLLAIMSLPSSFFIGILPISLFWQISLLLAITLASISALTYKE